MNSALVEIVVDAINDKYISEKAYYTNVLEISDETWQRWKEGKGALTYSDTKTLSTLFTDYEWMLVQKVVRNAEIMPEIMANPVREYSFLKFQIARKWIKKNLVRLEWYQTNPNEEGSIRKSNVTILQLISDYNFWGYSDVIEIRMPSVVRRQIETNEVKLLDWFDEEEARLKEEDK